MTVRGFMQLVRQKHGWGHGAVVRAVQQVGQHPQTTAQTATKKKKKKKKEPKEGFSKTVH